MVLCDELSIRKCRHLEASALHAPTVAVFASKLVSCTPASTFDADRLHEQKQYAHNSALRF
jgi:hypothetical protein